MIVKHCNIPASSILRLFLASSQNFASNYFWGIKGLRTTKEHVAHLSHCLGALTPILKALTLVREPGLVAEIT